MSVATPVVLTLNGVGAGNLLYVLIFKPSGTTRTFTVSSDLDGSFSSIEELSSLSRMAAVWTLGATQTTGVSGGNHSVTITPSGSTTARVTLVELSGMATGVAHVTDSLLDAAAGNSHDCSASGLTESGGCTVISTGCTTGSNFSTGVGVEGAGFTALDATNGGLVQLKDATGGVTSEKATWTNAGATRQCVNAMVVVPYAAAGPTLNLKRMSQVNLSLPFLRTGLPPGA